MPLAPLGSGTDPPAPLVVIHVLARYILVRKDKLAASAWRRSFSEDALVSDVIAILVLTILVCIVLAAHGQPPVVVFH